MTRASFHVRRATTADADDFAAQRLALARESHALAPGPAADAYAAATRRAFVAAVERGSCLVWLAVTGTGEIAGSSALYLVERLPSPPNPNPVEGYLAHMFVSPAWRRAGVGSALVRAAEDEARARALGRIRLHATASGRALYERFGFTPRVDGMELHLGPVQRT